MKRASIMGGLLLAMLVLRNAVFVQLRVFDAVPELVLLVAVAVALTEGPEAGALVGFAGGFLQDLTSTIRPVGLSCLAFVLVAFGVGRLHLYVIRPGRFLGPGLAGAAVFGAVVMAVLVGAVVGQEYLVSGYQLRVAFWASWYSAAAFPAVAWCVGRAQEVARIERAGALR